MEHRTDHFGEFHYTIYFCLKFNLIVDVVVVLPPLMNTKAAARTKVLRLEIDVRRFDIAENFA